MRAVSNSLLGLLLLGALLWGNCLSCPQLLLSLASHAAPHDCCKRPGHQPANSQAGCASFALQHFVKTDPAPKAQLQPAAHAFSLSPDGMPLTPAAAPVAIVVIPHSPPDLAVLNSTFRI
jgi:hypothetical protein